MSVGEMRKTLATNEVKVRDLQAKQAAFAAIERVNITPSLISMSL
jgi:hypothetical protein